ncbi:MAG: hypothetical protein HQK66_03255 [Desulfamplus sp.]|nr:hypothetical protein [Desulfamplus sp.]
MSIFISIASYRDKDCINTVKSLFENAVRPGELRVGICCQFIPGLEPGLIEMPERQDQLRQISIPAKEGRGPCWARRLIQHLWQDETYYFQVDSHMRFAAGWDEKLISLMEKCTEPRPVFSTYPLAFTPPDEMGQDALVEIMPRYFDDNGILHQHSALKPMPQTPLGPERTYFVSAGMLFTRGEVVREVPYDPFIYFIGEEMMYALRLWTHGYTIYNPNQVIAYHDYSTRTSRPRHWEDERDWHLMNQGAVKRIRHILELETIADKNIPEQLHQYGLGNIRTMASYEKAAEISFKKREWRGKKIIQPQPSSTSGS